MLPKTVPVSILVPTYNEESNLDECLQSVAWAHEVFVVDSYSQDHTELIARAHGAQFTQHSFENYAAQKNWALDSLPISQPWVMIIDADERVTPSLSSEIAAVAQLNDEEGPVGYYINRRFIFMGHWMQHAGWYPSWNLRLFQTGKARYEDRPVHEHMVVDGPVGYLKHDLIHDDGRGIGAWLARHNEYSTMEAKARWHARQFPDSTGLPSQWRGNPVQRKRAVREHIWPRLPAKPLLLFLYLYFVRLGILDGRQGLVFCYLQAVQEFHVGLKLREISSRVPDTGIE